MQSTNTNQELINNLGFDPNKKIEKVYQHQKVVDESEKLEIKRKIKNIAALKSLAEDLQAAFELGEFNDGDEAKWNFVCAPPDRILKDGDNLPAYIPAPDMFLEDGETFDYQDLVRWFIFQGLDTIIEDSYAKACFKSRDVDKDCRAKGDPSKFDDETFSRKMSINERLNKAKIEAEIKQVLTDACQGKFVVAGDPTSSIRRIQELTDMKDSCRRG